MKILIIHNAYGKFSGEEAVVDAHCRILTNAGHDVELFTRSSEELFSMRFGKLVGFVSAFINPVAISKLKDVLKAFKPDVVHIHNLYPLISPAILPVIQRAGIPIVMTVHNYRLICPNGLFYNQKGICEACAGGKEWRCVVNNCENSIPKSLGYALRNMIARLFQLYNKYVDIYFCLTHFQREKLVENGFDAKRCIVLPNFMHSNSINSLCSSDEKKGVLFIGRLNRSKGIDVLLRTAELCQEVPVFLAGVPDRSVVDIEHLPQNVEWLGIVSGQSKLDAFQRVVALVFTSRCYEGLPMVFLEAMQNSLPIIAPKLAGIPEIIREGYNGWLFEPNNPEDLASVIRYVLGHPEQAQEYGENGKKLLQREYSGKAWLEGYINALESIK